VRWPWNVGTVYNADNQRQLTIRAGAGYSPEVETIQGSHLNLEGLRFARGEGVYGTDEVPEDPDEQIIRIGGLLLQSYISTIVPALEDFLVRGVTLCGAERPKVDTFSAKGNDGLPGAFVERIFGWSVKESRHHFSPFARSQKGMFTRASPVAFPFCAEI
jgi:hypothetical protein